MDQTRMQNMHELGEAEMYGLFEIITQRFVFVAANSYALRLMLFLFSNRYQLILCRLDCAENYYHNIIDNDVASNWSMPLSKELFGNLQSHRIEYNVPKLIQVDPLDENELLTKDLPYLRYVFLLLADLATLVSDDEDGYMHEVDFLYREMLGAPFTHSRTDLLNNEILAIVYKEFDFATAQEKISNAINQYSI